ncbi:MAG: substrate-binding domain-containing protein, partial [Planctomycetales bacterium]|nr:substrate-binding domain-containing protein [Planctomycetales bacterium]
GVGNGLANRALQLLERRHTITRQQRRGAFISETPASEPSALLRRIHFLVHQNYLATEGIGNDHELLGIQAELPGVEVQISFLPREDPETFVGGLIDQSLVAKAKDGFILVRAPVEVHKCVFDAGVPAVVFGDVYPGPFRLPRIDRNMNDVGTLSAEYLLERGHKRFAFLSRQQCLPGDNATIEAIHRTLGAAELRVDALVERFLPADSQVAEAAVDALLQGDAPPTAFICRNRRLADAVTAVRSRLSARKAKKIDVVLCDHYLASGDEPAYVYPRPACDGEEVGRYLAQMLLELARNRQVADVVIPVHIDARAAR